MGLLFWKNNTAIDTFARDLADDLYSHVQPAVAQQHLFGTEKMARKKAVKADREITDVILQVKRFAKANSLGIYGKARLQQKFNQRLEELGYPAEVVNSLSEAILVQNV